MVDFESEDLGGSTFSRVRLAGSDFSRVELTGAHFWEVDLAGSRFDNVNLQDVHIQGDIDGLTVNGVPVAPLVQAELTRLYPEYAGLKPTDAQGYRDSWARLAAVWDATIARATALDAATLNAHVGQEWSFIQTLRHLSFAITSWLDAAILGRANPWQPLDLPWDQMPPHPDVPSDRDADVSLADARGLYDASAARLGPGRRRPGPAAHGILFGTGRYRSVCGGARRVLPARCGGGPGRPPASMFSDPSR